MKRLVALLLVAVLACSLVGCDLGSSDKSDENAPLMTGGVSATLTVDELEITVTKFVFSKYCGNLSSLGEAESGSVWCTVYLNVKNISKSAKILTRSYGTKYDFTLDYNNGYTYNTAWFEYAEFLNAHESIAPLETLSNVCVSYKVPLEVKKNTENSLKLKCSYNSQKETDYVEWELR